MEEARETTPILTGLALAGVEFIVVGGTAAIMRGAPITTLDVDILHRRTEQNVTLLLQWLLAHHACHRFDLANRRLPPAREQLMGSGHVNLQTDLGKLDVLCELALGEGYDEVVGDSSWLEHATCRVRVLNLERLITVKAKAGRPKDRMVLPILIATLDEIRKHKP